MNILVVIPARFHSSRFPGKPLAELAGMPLLQHVWMRCCQAIHPENVIIATDHSRIRTAALRFGANVEMTSKNCLTGTDRVAEVATRIHADWYVNVQGDEPLLDPNDLAKLVRAAKNANKEVLAINAMAPILGVEDFRSSDVPKVVTDAHDSLLYITRAPIPTNKNLGFEFGFRQVGIYAFRPDALALYQKGAAKTPLEEIEDIEILRLLEAGRKIQMIRVETQGPAVDTPGDLLKVKSILDSD